MTYYVFCDESGVGSHRHMVIGGILIHKDAYQIVNEEFNSYRRKLNMTSELKFSKITKQKLGEYLEFLTYIFSLIKEGYINFRCMTIDTYEIKRGGDKEQLFYKFYYQLAYHCFINDGSCDDSKLHVYLDYRNSKYKLDELKRILQCKVRKEYCSHGTVQCDIKSVEYRDSKEENLIQATDLLIGSMNFELNDKKNQALSNAKEAKIKFVEEAKKAVG